MRRCVQTFDWECSSCKGLVLSTWIMSSSSCFTLVHVLTPAPTDDLHCVTQITRFTCKSDDWLWNECILNSCARPLFMTHEFPFVRPLPLSLHKGDFVHHSVFQSIQIKAKQEEMLCLRGFSVFLSCIVLLIVQSSELFHLLCVCLFNTNELIDVNMPKSW